MTGKRYPHKWRIGLFLAGAALAIAGYLWLTAPSSRPDLPDHTRDLTMHVMPGVVPPTNHWFSSLAFEQPSHAVFAYPLAARTTTEGFELSYPKLLAQAHVVSAPFVKDFGVTFKGGPFEPKVDSYDDLSVAMAFTRGGQTRAGLRLVQGSPVIPVWLEEDTTLQLTGARLTAAGDWYRLAANNRQYGIFAKDAVIDPQTNTITGKKGARIHFFVLPDKGDHAAVAKAAQTAINGGRVAYTADAGRAQTTFTLKTDGGQPALLGLLPGQQGASDNLGSYQTLLGTMRLYRLQEHSFETKVPKLNSQLPLDNLSPQERDTLKKYVRQDAKNLRFTATDTYFGGKELYRVATLLQLANQLGLSDESRLIAGALRAQLSRWFEPRGAEQRATLSFYYDSTLRGVIGQQPSFGSEDFNDHHFHYGYFVYAAAIMAGHDPDFARQAKPVVTALLNDIAADAQTGHFPRLRVFDQYAGHSWASGFAPFNDGNNQESSSEAVNAWYGAYLWAAATGNDRLAQTARWLYARETDFALRHYLMTDRGAAGISGYQHQIVSLVWGGKLDYATFFSDTPEAKLAIQLIPMSPGSAYLLDDPRRIAERLDEIGDSPALFKDYLAMYRALIDRDQALRQAGGLSDKDIDGANSRSYLYAWIYAYGKP